jgi:hypothetical protein
LRFAFDDLIFGGAFDIRIGKRFPVFACEPFRHFFLLPFFSLLFFLTFLERLRSTTWHDFSSNEKGHQPAWLPLGNQAGGPTNY